MEPGGDWALAELESVWGLLHQAHKRGGSPAFGQLALGSMLNACVYRLKHPGEVALPHLYADRLWRQFPLPIVVVQGQYYQDSSPHGGVADPDSMGEPYPLTTMELLHDIMSLVTLRPMRKGLSGCGFVEDKSDCFYTRAGLGCPQKGLTEEQFNIRRQVGLDDWCHWLMRTLVLRTAPSAALDRWLSLWRTEAARKK
jgi:hypothetical protein